MRFVSIVTAMILAAVLTVAGGAAANAGILIQINKMSQRMTVTVDGQMRYTWPVSTGRVGYATPSGSYTAFRMERDHFSKEWDDAPMPYSIFFTGEGHAIHGTYDTRHLGRPVSHGCVRLSPQNAATLFALVKAEGLPNTRVVVTGPGFAFPRVGSTKLPTVSQLFPGLTKPLPLADLLGNKPHSTQ